jgi:phenylacetate-CoA ligase
MEIIGEAVARIFWMWGLRPGDKIQMGMPAWHKSQYGHEMGARTLGATLVGSTMYPIEAARVLIIQKYLRTEALVLPMGPPLLTALREEMRRLGFDPKDVWKGCKWIVSSGESYTDATLKKLEDEWGTKIYDIAGPGSELSAGVGECPVTRRLNHFPDDVAFLEIVDPATGKPSLPGERGELVWTHLWFESFPFLRWGAEDIGYLLTDPCPCGRTGTRHRMLDRMAFQIKVRGKTVLPYDIREVTEAIPETAEGILQLYDYAPQMDTLRIRLSYEPEKTKDVNELRNRLAQSIENKLSLSTEIELIEPWQLDKLGIIPHKYLRIIKG